MMDETTTNTTPRLKRSTYLSAMISRGTGSSSDWSTHEIQAESSPSNHHHHKASSSRRKVSRCEGPGNNRDYFDLRRPNVTAPAAGGGGEGGAQPVVVLPPSGGVANTSSISRGATNTKAAPNRRRRVSDEQHRRRHRGSLLSSSLRSTNSLQYYYPNPFSTASLNDLMRLQQLQQQPQPQGHPGGGTTIVSPESNGHDQLDTAWLDQLDRQDSLRRQDLKNKEENDPAHEDDDEEEEEAERVAPLSYRHQFVDTKCSSSFTRRTKKRIVPSGCRSLPQLGQYHTFSSSPTTTATSTLHTHVNSYSTLNYFTTHHHTTTSSKKNFFQQVLDHPIDGTENDVNSRRRNEAWKEIRLGDEEEEECFYDEYEVVGEVSDDESRGYYGQWSGVGRLLLAERGSMDNSGMVSDDNDISGSEESNKSYVRRGASSSSFDKKRKSVDDSLSGEDDDKNYSHHSAADAAPISSPPKALVPPRRVNTVGAGLAYGSDAWRSYHQSKVDVFGRESRLCSSLGR